MASGIARLARGRVRKKMYYESCNMAAIVVDKDKQPSSTAYIFVLGHRSVLYGHLTPVKRRYPLLSIR